MTSSAPKIAPKIAMVLAAGGWPPWPVVLKSLAAMVGARSAAACEFLREQGFQEVLNLKGGILDWMRDGFEVLD